MRTVLAGVVFAGLLSGGAAAGAQQAPLPDMQQIAAALGVRCEYCHGQGREAPRPATASGRSRLDVAREMIAMTRALSVTVAAAAGKDATQAVRVQCVTCHRGVPIPRQLADIVWQTAVQQGADAAVAQYRELRAQFYGRQAYDFGEESLFAVGERLAQARPPAAVALMQMNLEFYPRSARSYAILARAQARQQDGAAAIASLRKALEIEPENGTIRGQLLQLERQFERR